MKNMIQTLIITLKLVLFTINVKAQTIKDGTPDMRYNSNKQYYVNTYSTPSYTSPKTDRNYNSGGEYKVQNVYIKSNGSYVSTHIKTTPDNYKRNNYKPGY
jgi:hypothetical protein